MRIIHQDHNSVGQAFKHVYRLDSGRTVDVLWQRICVGDVPPSARMSETAYPWFVTFRLDGQVFAEHYRPAKDEPDPLSCCVWEHEVISAYQVPVKAEPPRRGLLYHLVAGAVAWYHGGA